MKLVKVKPLVSSPLLALSLREDWIMSSLLITYEFSIMQTQHFINRQIDKVDSQFRSNCVNLSCNSHYPPWRWWSSWIYGRYKSQQVLGLSTEKWRLGSVSSGDRNGYIVFVNEKLCVGATSDIPEWIEVRRSQWKECAFSGKNS